MKRLSVCGLSIVFILFCLAWFAGCTCDDDDDNDDDQAVDDDASPDDDTTLPDDDASPDDDDDDSSPADDDDDDTSPAETFRFIVMSDPTIVPPATNEVTFWWNDRLDQAVEQINAEADIQFVLLIGDVAADMMEPWVDDVVDGWEVASALAKEKLDLLQVPYYLAPGDKDYTDEVMTYEFAIDWADWNARETRLHEIWGDAYPGANPWNVIEHEGVRFFLANSTAGPRLAEANGMTGSFGEDQLNTLANELSGDQWTVFFSHHPGVFALEEAGAPTLEEILSAKADKVAGFFHGHLLGFQKYEWADLEGYSLGGINQSYLYYAIVEVNPATGELTILNEDQLAFPEDWQEFQCEPGQDTAGSLSSLVDTVHSLFISEFKTNYWLVNLFLANADVGNSPMPLWVLEDNSDETFDIEMTQAQYAHWEDGDWVVIYSWSTADVACDVFTFSYNDPCLATVDANIAYDLMSIIEPWGVHAACNVQLLYDTDFLLEIKMGEDTDGNLSFPQGQISLTLGKDAVIETIQQFIVDSYCADDWCGGYPLMAGEGCSAETNGDTAACNAGTLTFADVPTQCDTWIGDNYKIPMRIILAGMGIIPEDFEVTFLLKGWGHKMTLVGDYTTDYFLETDVFGLNTICPVQMSAE